MHSSRAFKSGRAGFEFGNGGFPTKANASCDLVPLIRLLFQCKRYKDGKPITPSQVRDFRGAMAGRPDKGLIFTTTSFTSEARKEATRDGVPPIELVDGEKLVTMFARVELGLKPVQTYEVDGSFFEEFRR